MLDFFAVSEHDIAPMGDAGLLNQLGAVAGGVLEPLREVTGFFPLFFLLARARAPTRARARRDLDTGHALIRI